MSRNAKVRGHFRCHTPMGQWGGEWREGTSPSRSLRTVRDSLPSYGSHSPAWSICRFLPRGVDLQTTVNCPAPSLRPHYRALTATTGRSAPVPRIGTLALAVPRCLWFSPSRPKTPAVSIRGDRFSCSMPAPATSSRHLYTGHRRGHIQPAPRLRTHRGGPLSQDHPQIPVSMPSLFRFDASAVVHTCSPSQPTPAPANSETSPAALTTPALDRRSLRWFGISACTATPQDLPPSLAQHGSCRRSSTSSSSLPFRTHVGARNCVGDSV